MNLLLLDHNSSQFSSSYCTFGIHPAFNYNESTVDYIMQCLECHQFSDMGQLQRIRLRHPFFMSTVQPQYLPSAHATREQTRHNNKSDKQSNDSAKPSYMYTTIYNVSHDICTQQYTMCHMTYVHNNIQCVT